MAEIRVARQLEFTGPLPPPSVLAGYEAALPGLADRIVKMAEATLAQSHSNQTEQLRLVRTNLEIRHAQQSKISSRGFILAMSCVVVGAFAIWMGAPLGGLALIFSAIAALLGAFMYGRKAELDLYGPAPKEPEA